MSHSVAAVICAAGKGSRTGFETNKLLVPFEGSTVLEKTLSAFDFSLISEIVVTSNERDFQAIANLCARFERTKVVVGGNTRFKSVYNALQTVNADMVLVHDGARPFVTREIVEECVRSVQAFGSGICAIPATDTVAVCKNGKIVNVPDRNTLAQIQTPQGFFTENIRTAYKLAKENGEENFTDDSSVFARYCGAPTLCKGARENVKLTYAEDFAEKTARCGFGIDTHAFGKEQDHIMLGGVKIPSQNGLIAHSDGDVLIHALMDSLLSAAGLRDIGYYFPDTDEKWKGASSVKMLERVHGMLQELGYGVKNVSIAVQAERPRLAKYVDDMKNVLAGVLKIDQTAIGITAGTNEGLGYVGEGKGITVHAYTLLSHTR